MSPQLTTKGLQRVLPIHRSWAFGLFKFLFESQLHYRSCWVNPLTVYSRDHSNLYRCHQSQTSQLLDRNLLGLLRDLRLLYTGNVWLICKQHGKHWNHQPPCNLHNYTGIGLKDVCLYRFATMFVEMLRAGWRITFLIPGVCLLSLLNNSLQ